MSARGRDALAVVVDVSQPEATEHMAQATMARFGRIEGLINMTGQTLVVDGGA